MSGSNRYVLKNDTHGARLPPSFPLPIGCTFLSASESSRPRIAAVLGLTLLEVIRAQDFPAEILQDEDPTVTLPRRLGLSDVVERQIRHYRESVRKRRRISDTEAIDLMRLVLRRPDSEEVFLRAGRQLAGTRGKGPGWVGRTLPPGFTFRMARRYTRRRLKRLFGRSVGAFAPGPFVLEGSSLIFYRSDPGGDACHFVTGFCRAVLESEVAAEAAVIHDRCQSRGDSACRWTATVEARVEAQESVPDLLRGPELEAG